MYIVCGGPLKSLAFSVDTEVLGLCNNGLDEKDKKCRDLSHIDIFDDYIFWWCEQQHDTDAHTGEISHVGQYRHRVFGNKTRPPSFWQTELRTAHLLARGHVSLPCAHPTILGRHIEMLLVKEEIYLIEHLYFRFTKYCPHETKLHPSNFYNEERLNCF